MTETTEPTRDQIEVCMSGDWPTMLRHREDTRLFRSICTMALRTLDAEAKLDHAHTSFTARDARADETIAALSNELAAMTERAELAEAQITAADAAVEALTATTGVFGYDLRAIRDAAMTHARGFMRGGETAAPAIERMATALREATERAEKAERERDEAWAVQGMAVARAEKAECALAAVERERDEGRDMLEHVRRVARRNLLSCVRHRNALMDERDEARAQIAERDRYIAEQRAITEPSVQDLARQLREATERTEKAECALAAAERRIAEVGQERDALKLAVNDHTRRHVKQNEAIVEVLRAKLADAERKHDEDRAAIVAMIGDVGERFAGYSDPCFAVRLLVDSYQDVSRSRAKLVDALEGTRAELADAERRIVEAERELAEARAKLVAVE